MKTPKLLGITTTAALLAFALQSQATTALDGPWYTGSGGAASGTPAFSPDNTSSSFTWGSGINQDGAQSGMLWSYFEDQLLANDGDSVKLSFTAQWSEEASANVSNNLRFGLFDHNGSTLEENLDGSNSSPAFNQSLGYFGTVNLDDSEFTSIFAREGGENVPVTIDGSGNGSDTVLVNNGTVTNAAAANIPYGFSFEIMRNSASEYTLTLLAGSGEASVTTGIITADTFNSFYLLNTPNTDLDSIMFSDFQVGVIPEPKTYGLIAGLAGLGLVLLRRRRTGVRA